MTEQEIINFLKENKAKGVGFAFMPEEVKNWCRYQNSKRIFCVFVDEDWRSIDTDYYRFENEEIICLSWRYKEK